MKVTLLIPAFQASATLPFLLNQLKSRAEISLTIVVDDGSTDGSAEVATEAGVMVLRHTVNRGKGAALRTGFEYIRTNSDTEVVITMDADLQHRVEDLPLFLQAREVHGTSIVIGRRVRWGVGMPIARIASNTITSFLVSARTGVPIADSQCGYRLIGREVIDRVTIEANGYEAETEFLIKAAKKGFSIEFVPIQTVYANETSHMTHLDTTRLFIKTLVKEY